MPEQGSSLRPIAKLARSRAPEVALQICAADPPEPLDARLVLLVEPRSARADAFRLARHRLERRQDPRLIAVTSASAGDGKTTLAVNLALAIAEEHGPSVLLLDAHRARPALADLLGLSKQHDVLGEGASRGYPLGRVSGTELCAGLSLGEPGHITQTERDALRRALTELRLAFDYVIVDTAPVGEGLDVHWLGELVDGVLFAVRRGVTDRRSLSRAISGLMPVPLAGGVLLDF